MLRLGRPVCPAGGRQGDEVRARGRDAYGCEGPTRTGLAPGPRERLCGPEAGESR